MLSQKPYPLAKESEAHIIEDISENESGLAQHSTVKLSPIPKLPKEI